VTVWLTRHPEIKETVLFRVDSQTQRTCHAVEASLAPRIDEEDTVVPVIIRNKGIAGGVYDVSLNGALYDAAQEQKVTLEPGEEAVLHLQTRENLTDYFNGKYLSDLNLTLEQGNITYATPFWTRFTHLNGLVRLWRSIVNYDYGSLGACFWSVLLLVLILLAVAAWLIVLLSTGHVARPLTKGWLTALRALLIAAILLLAVILVTTKLPSTQYTGMVNASSGLVFQWHENERFTIDLSQYFTDPDKDWLEYTATQPAHIKIRIDGSQATLIPEHNWAGMEKVVFTATDQRGGYDDSPFLILNVLRREHVSLRQWIDRYCTQLLLGLLLLLAALLAALAIWCLAPKRRVPYGVVVEPPKRPAVHTRVSRQGQVEKMEKVVPGERFTYLDAQGRERILGVAEKMAWPKKGGQKQQKSGVKQGKPKRTTKPAVRARTRKLRTKQQRVTTTPPATQQIAHSRAMDAKLVSSEEHEMKQVLMTHGKRQTARNIRFLRDALKEFKTSRGFKPKNRKNFYRFLRERHWLRRLHNRK